MSTNSLFKAFSAAQAQIPGGSPAPSDFGGDVLVVRGWRPGYSVIGTIKVLRGFGYGLKAAKHLAERVMQEDLVRIPLPDYVRSDRASRHLDAEGANVTVEKVVRPRVVHVVPRDDHWAVQKEGASRATRRFDTQSEAISFAVEYARRQLPGRLIVHRENGRIRSVRTFPSKSVESGRAVMFPFNVETSTRTD